MRDVEQDAGELLCQLPHWDAFSIDLCKESIDFLICKVDVMPTFLL